MNILMSNDQLLRLWVVIAFSFLILLFLGALTNRENGIVLGFTIGTGKIAIAVIITILAIGLIGYLFRDKRRFGHVAIFFILFGVFGWVVNTLVNVKRRYIELDKEGSAI